MQSKNWPNCIQWKPDCRSLSFTEMQQRTTAAHKQASMGFANRHFIQVLCTAPSFEQHSPEFYEENNIPPPTTLQPVLIDVRHIQAIEKCEHNETECHIMMQDSTQYHACVPYEVMFRLLEGEGSKITDLTTYNFG
jgi:DNA/RNA endonuclease G (NUC1)